MNESSRRLLAEGLLASVAIFWGATFPLIKEAVAEVPVLSFLAMRFTLASLFLALAAGKSLATMGRRGVSQGVSLGIILFLCYLFQTLGLERTTASNAGFLSGLGMVWIPILSGPLVGKKPGGYALAGVGLAVAGLSLLTWHTPWELNPGDALVILSSLFVALHILGVDALSECCDGRSLAFVQVATMAVLSMGASLLLDPVTLPRHASPELLRAILFTSLFATVYAFWVQSSFQRLTTPTRAAVIYTLEPVAAAVFAHLLAGERLGPLGLAGGGLIVLGMLAARLRPSAGSRRA